MDLELPTEASALLDAVLAIGSDLDLRGVLSRIVEAACQLTDAEYGVLGLVDDEGNFTDLVPNQGGATAFGSIGMLPKGHGLLGMVPRERKTIRVDHVAGHPASTGGFPRAHPMIDSFLGAPVLVGDHAFGHLYLGNKHGRAVFTATDQALVEALGRAAGVMINNARTFEQVEWRQKWLHAAAEISADLAGGQQVQAALERSAVVLRELCGAGLVAHVRHTDGVLEVRQVAGESEVAVAAVDRLAREIREVVASGTPVRLPGDRGRVTLLLPVVTRLSGHGVILVEDAEEGPALRGLMLDMVSVTAVQVGLILDREQALRDRAQLLVAKDRDRIARDLHDLVIQRLFATGMQLQAGMGLEADALRTRVDGAVVELDVAIKELRSAIFELRSEPGRPLLDEVRALLAEYATALGFQPMLRVSGPVDRALLPEAGKQVLATLRELLANVARHAGASSVTVTMTATSAWFRVRVSDDGAGFDPSLVERGHGTHNVETRAQDLGGHAETTSAPGQGTVVEWVIPAMG